MRQITSPVVGDRASVWHWVRCTHVQTTGPPRRFHRVVIMTVMADKGGKPVRTGPERIRKLAQAALNADVTVEQVDTILEGLSETLVDLNNST
jgi:hypothetical protein